MLFLNYSGVYFCFQDERDRIEGMGGAVLYWGAWRVNGQLAVSRAIGELSPITYRTGPITYRTGPTAYRTGPTAYRTGPIACHTGPITYCTGPIAYHTGP
jgi:hypothetical protein